jgi:hypothetical protein
VNAKLGNEDEFKKVNQLLDEKIKAVISDMKL